MCRKMKPTSRVSFTALRNRTTDSAPTRAKARAIFDPTPSITNEMITR
jgi:hypothetical protein